MLCYRAPWPSPPPGCPGPAPPAREANAAALRRPARPRSPLGAAPRCPDSGLPRRRPLLPGTRRRGPRGTEGDRRPTGARNRPAPLRSSYKMAAAAAPRRSPSAASPPAARPGELLRRHVDQTAWGRPGRRRRGSPQGGRRHVVPSEARGLPLPPARPGCGRHQSRAPLGAAPCRGVPHGSRGSRGRLRGAAQCPPGAPGVSSAACCRPVPEPGARRAVKCGRGRGGVTGANKPGGFHLPPGH